MLARVYHARKSKSKIGNAGKPWNRGRYPYGKRVIYAKINSMKENVQIPQEHYSYTAHRRQAWLQIFLPIILAVALIIVVAVVTSMVAFGGTGDSVRWAAVSTIWLLVPTMIFGLIFLAILSGLVYLLARTLQVLPTYTSNAQYYLNRVASQIKHFSDTSTRPVFFVEEVKARVKAIFGRY